MSAGWIGRAVEHAMEWIPLGVYAARLCTRVVTDTDFEHTVTTNDIVLVDLRAAWSGPCRMFAPV